VSGDVFLSELIREVTRLDLEVGLPEEAIMGKIEPKIIARFSFVP
jgi:hypothetical protein